MILVSEDKIFDFTNYSNSESEPEEDLGTDMRKTNMRWLMLIMACCFTLGSTFCYDNPGPLET